MDMIKEMEDYAIKHDIPIMQKEGMEFLCKYIKEHKIKRILEIGSAIGYSSICMAMVDTDIEIVTIERDEERYQIAVDNIKKMDLTHRITLIHGDALEATITGKYDMLFIDAAKAQYSKFFERYEALLNEHATVVSDNLSFHGYVDHPEMITSRNLRQLVRKLKTFKSYLESRIDYDTKFYEIGDGITISVKKNQKS